MTEKASLKPQGRTTLIGSFPVSDHKEALAIVKESVPEIPLWAQLPQNPGELMVPQFAHGLPGLAYKDGNPYLDTADPGFEEDLLHFYEDYLKESEAPRVADDSRFALTPGIAPGFFTLLEALPDWPVPLFAVKGQVTGPFTLATSLTDQEGRAVFYDDRLRDVVAKSIALKARWQAEALAAAGVPVILFLDEPGLTGFGSSAFISISREDVQTLLGESLKALNDAGAYPGIHICGNADWPLVLDSDAWVASFDAYQFFEPFAAFHESLVSFLKAGKILATGIVPTLNPDDVDKETTETLAKRLLIAIGNIADLGFSRREVLDQILVTPACGTGSLNLERTKKVLDMTGRISEIIRNEILK